MADEHWLAAGLGNPGPKYAATRHNVGADAARGLVERHRAQFSSNKRVRCEVATARLSGGERLTVVVPQVAMNRSGGPVQQAAKWYDVPAERLVVLHDDIDLELGAIKLKRGGGHGGHNGLRDLDRALGASDYLRVRIGIGRPGEYVSARDHVLSRFPADEHEVVEAAVARAGEAAEMMVTDGLEPAQNRFHGSHQSAGG